MYFIKMPIPNVFYNIVNGHIDVSCIETTLLQRHFTTTTRRSIRRRRTLNDMRGLPVDLNRKFRRRTVTSEFVTSDNSSVKPHIGIYT